jgi:hypothetical protein
VTEPPRNERLGQAAKRSCQISTGKSARLITSGDFGERRCFGIAYRNTADTKKSTLGRGLGDTLADLTQPVLEGGSIARSLCA